MAFTFPTDSTGLAGAIKTTVDGNNYYVPVVVNSSDGSTPISSTNPLSVTIQNSGINLPVELKSLTRTYLFTTATNLTSNSAFISPVYDLIDTKTIQGYANSDQSGTIYVQESDDTNTWYNTMSVAVTASTSTTISGTAYNDCVVFSKDLTMRYARIAYLNGATGQTRFALSAYYRTL